LVTVALTGGDGAGKTTVARRLVETSPIPLVYLYMGPNIESSNLALPWSRLFLRLKLRSYRKVAAREGITDPSFVSTHHNAHRKVQRGPVGVTLRMVNRLLEAAFRQLVAFAYQCRGYTVLYDRHFLLESVSPSGRHGRWTDRFYHWVLATLFPAPDLVVFLDAPAEVLLARKGEGTIESLQRARDTMRTQGPRLADTVTVDASRPLEDVLAEVQHHLAGLVAGARS
jgi:thymidylate kinase